MERGREGNTADLSQPELEKRYWESNTVDHNQSRKREHTMDKKAKRKRSPNQSEKSPNASIFGKILGRVFGKIPGFTK